MTKHELLDLMRLGEGLTLEFKRSVSADLGREICAFANAIGGRIVVGADDEGNLVGSGIQRIRGEMKNYGLEPPVIETGETWFSIVFRRKAQDSAINSQETQRGITPSGDPSGGGVNEGVNGGVNDGLVQLLNHIRLHPGLRTPANSKELNVPAKTIERWLKTLKQQGAVQFRGSSKRGGYHLLPPAPTDTSACLEAKL
ncbi:MAG: putative DNA binding domain-containing protein [Magnetococcus sp. WYHC-3]